jgi:hypothetical protein
MPAVIASGLVTRLKREGVEHLQFGRLNRTERSDAIRHALENTPRHAVASGRKSRSERRGTAVR